MAILILVLHILAAISVVVLVLLQHGKGADMGAAFGSGSPGSLFGASGSANFLSRATAVLAAVFFLTSLGLTYLSSHKTESKGVMESQPASEAAKVSAPQIPAVPAEQEQSGSRAKDIPK